jgi:site-specific DNA-methyltransferase (adenine-specific)
MTEITLHPGDNRLTLRRLIDEGVRVHSVVTDPPYGLVSVQKRFGKQGSKAAWTTGNDGSFARLSGGFMGKQWDGTGIERDPDFWQLIYDILLPGGYVFAFSGSRTGHWQACAMEVAGFIMHPVHGWVFGSGFPKAHAADKAIDMKLGVKGGFIAEGEPVRRMIPGADQHREGSWIKDNGREYQPGSYIPGSPEASEWEGWGYGTQAQKPALEPIYLGQKPFSEKTGAANLLKHGVGAVNIDGCMVPSASGDPRHPANLILDGSDDVVAMFPTSKGQQGAVRGNEPSGVTKGIYGKFKGRVPAPSRGDSGSSARFFHQFPQHDPLPGMNPLFYNSKAGKTDRAGSKHPTVKPIALMQYLIRHITPPGGVVLDPFAGSGTTAEAATREGFDCILMEAEDEYVDFLRKRFGITSHEDQFSDIFGEAAPLKSTESGVSFDDVFG